MLICHVEYSYQEHNLQDGKVVMQQTLLVDQLVGQIFGEYRVERLLGRGRLSAVYLAQHPAQRKNVALTTFILPEHFSPEERNRFLARFYKEAAQLTPLSHRHLLPVYAYGEQFGYPYLITPYMTEGSLADVLKQQGRLSPAHVLGVLEQIASGLDYVHSQGVVHGSIKPSNILLDGQENMLVAGFGLAHILQMRGVVQSDKPYAHLLSIADTFLGSPEYLAPEFVQGQVMDARSDMYAIGIILFELLTGKPPFTGTSPLEVARMHVQQPLPSLRALAPDIPVALEFVVQHALARNPAERFQRVGELTEAFAQVCRGTLNNTSPLTGTSPLKTTAEREAANSANMWQLKPPVVTDKSSVVRVSPESDKYGTVPMSTGQHDSWQLKPPIVTGKMAAFDVNAQAQPQRPMAASQPVPNVQPRQPMPPAQPVQLAQPMQPMQMAQTAQPTQRPAPMPPYALQPNAPAQQWSYTAQPQPPAPAAPSAPPPLRLPQPIQSADPFQMRRDPFGMDAGQYQSVSSMSPRQRPRKTGRRKMVAMLATGGVIAAGALVFGGLELHHMMSPTTATAHTTTSNKTASTQANKGTTTGTKTTTTGNTGTKSTTGSTGTTQQNPPATHTGQVIGTKQQAVNTAIVFTNTADNQAALLVHLPNNNFVAYERACTHQQYPVVYNPTTQKFVCNLHGSIFDPANNGAVVQGPAVQPLKSVAIHVNTDGTISL